jgi:hypothetical protein
MKKKYYLFEMNMIALNAISIIIFIGMMLLSSFLMKGVHFDGLTMGLFIIILIPYLCFHEVLHSIGYIITGADPKRITFGAHLEKGVLCCLCKQNVSKKSILVSLLFPFVWIGVITYIIGIVFNLPILVGLSVMNISGCSGDLLMFFNFLFIKNFEYAEYDSPVAFGLYSSDDLSKKKLIGLNYVETKDKLEQNDLKKISITKTSVIILIALVLLGILDIVVSFL